MGNSVISLRTTVMAVALAAFSVCGQDYMPPTNIPPAADYEPQGEYYGTVNGVGLGAWLIARGSSRFDVVILPGGLLALRTGDPYGGWNGTTRYSATNIALTGTTFNATAGAYTLTSITGSGANRALVGSTGGTAFQLTRLTGVYGIGGPRQGQTLGLRPEGKSWSTGFVSLFNEATATADLSKWVNSGTNPQLKYGNYLFRGVRSSAAHGSCFLHIEARSAFSPTASGQSRGNSGVYLRNMHEMQVLDSFGLTGAANELGAVYNIRAPLVNAALPPLTWQVYDIYYTANAGTNGVFTTYLNGVLVQNATVVTVVTEAGSQGTSLMLQNHNNEVIFNNIWYIPNATTTSLPYASILPTTRIDTYHITPKLGHSHIESFPHFDLLGRTPRKLGNRNLRILPIME